MGWIDKCISGCKKWDMLAARLLVGGMFVLAGVNKFMDVAGTAGYIESAGLPMAVMLVYLAGALEVLGGLTIITGFYFRYGAIALATFTILATAFFHNDWSDQTQMTLALKNGGILAALLYMKVFGPGSMAFGEKKMAEPAPVGGMV